MKSIHHYIAWGIRIVVICGLAYIIARLSLQFFFWLPEPVRIGLMFLALLVLAVFASAWVFIAYVEDFFDPQDKRDVTCDPDDPDFNTDDTADATAQVDETDSK